MTNKSSPIDMDSVDGLFYWPITHDTVPLKFQIEVNHEKLHLNFLSFYASLGFLLIIHQFGDKVG